MELSFFIPTSPETGRLSYGRISVSYTHLDVYKRQEYNNPIKPVAIIELTGGDEVYQEMY